MTPHTDRSTARREFIGQLAGAALALAGTACATAPGVAATPQGAAAPALPPASPRQAAPTHFDDSWAARITARHRSVYDSPAIKEGDALDRAWSVMSGYHDAIGANDADLNVVIVIRHAAIPMAFNDAMWAKYQLGKELKLSDPATGQPAERNPFLRVLKGDKHAMVPADGSLEALQGRGVILLACNRALMGRGYTLAQKTKADVATVQEELRSNLVPGVILQPNGIYAVARAQEMGCALISAG